MKKRVIGSPGWSLLIIGLIPLIGIVIALILPLIALLRDWLSSTVQTTVVVLFAVVVSGYVISNGRNVLLRCVASGGFCCARYGVAYRTNRRFARALPDRRGLGEP